MEEKREREVPIGWRGRRECNVSFFCKFTPHTSNILTLLHLTPNNTYFHKPNLSKDFLYFNLFMKIRKYPPFGNNGIYRILKF